MKISENLFPLILKVSESKSFLFFSQQTKLSDFESKIIFIGQEQDQREAKEFLIKAFFISVFLITIIINWELYAILKLLLCWNKFHEIV